MSFELLLAPHAVDAQRLHQRAQNAQLTKVGRATACNNSVVNESQASRFRSGVTHLTVARGGRVHWWRWMSAIGARPWIKPGD